MSNFLYVYLFTKFWKKKERKENVEEDEERKRTADVLSKFSLNENTII